MMQERVTKSRKRMQSDLDEMMFGYTDGNTRYEPIPVPNMKDKMREAFRNTKYISNVKNQDKCDYYCEEPRRNGMLVEKQTPDNLQALWKEIDEWLNEVKLVR